MILIRACIIMYMFSYLLLNYLDYIYIVFLYNID